MYADTHCHLCAGLDDGPRDESEVLEMFQMAWNEGIRAIAVTAHQNEQWPLVPEQIIQSANQLSETLQELDCPMYLAAVGEVMISHETLDRWQAGELLSYGNAGKYLLVEYPHGLFLDIRALAEQLVAAGVRPVIAHAERFPDLLHGSDNVEQLIECGCLIQVSTCGMDMLSRGDMRALKQWAQRGIVHVMGTDAHSPRRRRPMVRKAFQQFVQWIGGPAADRIFWENGERLLRGAPIQVPKPLPRQRSWFSR